MRGRGGRRPGRRRRPTAGEARPNPSEGRVACGRIPAAFAGLRRGVTPPAAGRAAPPGGRAWPGVSTAPQDGPQSLLGFAARQPLPALHLADDRPRNPAQPSQLPLGQPPLPPQLPNPDAVHLRTLLSHLRIFLPLQPLPRPGAARRAGRRRRPRGGRSPPLFWPGGPKCPPGRGAAPCTGPRKPLGIAYRSDFFANVKGFDRI